MAPADDIPSEIAGYSVLPLPLPPLPSFPTAATHYLYLRPHEPKVHTPNAARSLFLVNVPFDSTELHIKNLLSVQLGLPQGRIEEVHFEATTKPNNGSGNAAAGHSRQPSGDKKRKRIPEVSEFRDIEDIPGAALPATWDRQLRKGDLTAVVLFVDRASMDAAFKAVKRVIHKGKPPVWGEGLDGKVPELGSARYLKHFELQYPDHEQLKETINIYMTEYAAREAARTQQQARQRQVPDEDGFVTVTKGGRTGPARQEAAQELAEKQKEKQKGFEDFYRFQTREKKKEKAAEIMKKFEEDQEKVRKMKEKRGQFQPE